VADRIIGTMTTAETTTVVTGRIVGTVLGVTSRIIGTMTATETTTVVTGRIICTVLGEAEHGGGRDGGGGAGTGQQAREGDTGDLDAELGGVVHYSFLSVVGARGDRQPSKQGGRLE
jgi:hypothetical protein